MLFGVTWPMDSDQFGSVFLASIIYLQAFVVIKYPAFVKAPTAGSGTSIPPGAPAPPAEPARATRAAPDNKAPRLPRYANSSLTPEQSEAYLQTLKACMERNKPFQDAEVRLADVAEAVSMTPHHLSQVINDGAGMTFRDFINVYRVEEVKRKLKDPRETHKSILALAVEAGFGNKSSFNRAFKHHTGTTPSAYRLAERPLNST
jgi:AraC-like DNA-binding protein